MNRQLRARIVLEEARALGIDLDDLVAAATGDAKPITVTAWVDEIAVTFGPSTARTYRPYWRLLVAMFGDRSLAELTTTDLAAVVDAAGERAKAHRPDSTGRASRETCIAALRAIYARAVDAGHLTTNPSAALRKPRRTTSRRRALDDSELVTSLTPSGPPAAIPTSTCLWSGFTSRPAPAYRAPSACRSETSMRLVRRCGSARSTRRPGNSPPHRP